MHELARCSAKGCSTTMINGAEAHGATRNLDPETDLTTHTIPVLKSMCDTHGLSTKGTKHELIARLKEPDQHRLLVGSVSLKVTANLGISALRIVQAQYRILGHPCKENISMWRTALQSVMDSTAMGCDARFPQLYAACQFLGSKRGPNPEAYPDDSPSSKPAKHEPSGLEDDQQVVGSKEDLASIDAQIATLQARRADIVGTEQRDDQAPEMPPTKKPRLEVSSLPAETKLPNKKKPFQTFSAAYISARKAHLRSLQKTDWEGNTEYLASFIKDFEDHEEYYLWCREERLRGLEPEEGAGCDFADDVFEASLSGVLGDACILLEYGGTSKSPDEYWMVTPCDGINARINRTKPPITLETAEWKLTRGLARCFL